MGVEEPNESKDGLHLLEIHQEEDHEDRAGRVSLRTRPVRPVRVDYRVDVGEVVPLKDKFSGERFFPYPFRFLVIVVLYSPPAGGFTGARSLTERRPTSSTFRSMASNWFAVTCWLTSEASLLTFMFASGRETKFFR